MINKYEIIKDLVSQLQIEINCIKKFSYKLISITKEKDKDKEVNNTKSNSNTNLNFSSIEIFSSILQRKKLVNKLFEILNQEINTSK
jgi:hypothetical protein